MSIEAFTGIPDCEDMRYADIPVALAGCWSSASAPAGRNTAARLRRLRSNLTPTGARSAWNCPRV